MDDADEAKPEESPYLRLPWALVAAGLMGVLLVALGIGLFANRSMRPQVEVVPTASLVPTTIGIAVAPAPGPTLAPRSAPPTTAAPVAEPTVTAPPTPRPHATVPPTPVQPTPTMAAAPSTAMPQATVKPELASEIGAAYERYWQVRAEALYTLDTSRLPEVMADDHLVAAEELIAQLQSEGRAIQTEVTHNYAILKATSAEAEIADEYRDDSVYVDINSRQSLTQPAAGAVKEQYQMNKIDGTWRVVSLVRAP